MRVDLQPALILHHRPYRETSLLVDLLTRDYGRIAGVARGIRTPRSRNRALMQPFVPLWVAWHGKGELVTLGTVESNGQPFNLTGDCLLTAFYLNELLMRLLPKHDPHSELYDIYYETLEKLQGNNFEQKTLRIFEKKLLEQIGYGLQLQYDMSEGSPIVAEQSYFFCTELGFKRYSQDEDIPAALIFAGESILAFAHEDFLQPESLQDAKRLMRLALSPILGLQPLQSRKLFLEVEAE